MKVIRAAGMMPVLELTRRNLIVLLTKLDDPTSARTLLDGDNLIAVTAVEDADHYADREPGEVADRTLTGLAFAFREGVEAAVANMAEGTPIVNRYLQSTEGEPTMRVAGGQSTLDEVQAIIDLRRERDGQ